MKDYVILNNGVKMPRLGFGVYQIYGNAQAVGDALVHSSIPREDIFVTSKIWVDKYGYDQTLQAFDDSMKKLKLDYIDLYLIHKPYNDYYGTWRALERLYKEGRIRAIS